MEFRPHRTKNQKSAEIISGDIVIDSVDTALDLIGNLGYQGFDAAIIHAKNLSPDFFDLSTKLAGEVLQKFTNYRLRLVIVGDFSNVESKSLRDFILESNKGKQVNFVATIEQALGSLSK